MGEGRLNTCNPRTPTDRLNDWTCENKNGLLRLGWRRLICRASVLNRSGDIPSVNGFTLRNSMCIRRLDAALAPRVCQLWNAKYTRLRECSRFSSLLNELINNTSMFKSFWVGDARAPFLLPSLPIVKGAFTTKELIHGLSTVVAKGRRKPCETALTLTDGAEFRCPIGLPPVSDEHSLNEVLKYGTIFLNMACLHWRILAEICLAASAALSFPTNINVYVTGENRKVSTDVHTDNHDVLVMQTQGSKHWQVFAPLARRRGSAHPLYRGKNEDWILSEELGDPLIDVVLRPGESLFIPMGFPHSTGTSGIDARGVSVHLTLGISTADYGFSVGSLTTSVLHGLGLNPCRSEEELSDNEFWASHSPLAVGCLVPETVLDVESAETSLVSTVANHGYTAILRVESPSVCSDTRVLGACHNAATDILNKLLGALCSQDEAYKEVQSAPDGVFLATGPEETRSEYRRVIMEQQELDDIRKRKRADPTSEDFVRRTDPCDGASRTKRDVLIRCDNEGYSAAQGEDYWTHQCKPLYPNDRPPEDLMDELMRAGETCEGLLDFLRKRTPHLHSHLEDNETWEAVD